ncbi:MAG: DUF4179 domain-containing protein [Flavobacterium sp.]|nr:MAG: DUF4179 domain-containing protein [Flavobacterium sp.]
MKMKNENDMNEMFRKFEGQWNIEEPEIGHHQRFMERLEAPGKNKKKTFTFRMMVPVAAAILIIFGVFVTYNPWAAPQQTMANVSPQVKETQQYFTLIIKKEMAKVEKEDSPETKQLVSDALYRMDALEKDYEKLTQELIKKGENKQLIHAMITNMQTRISFLEEVLVQIDNIKTLKQKYNENNQI